MEPDKKHHLNMDEKKKLQKLLFSDIETAISRFQQKRREERGELKQKLISKEARELAAELKAAEETSKRAEKKLRELGYSYGGYPEKTLTLDEYPKVPQEL